MQQLSFLEAPSDLDCDRGLSGVKVDFDFWKRWRKSRSRLSDGIRKGFLVAIYHLTAKMIQRSQGQSSAGSSAYCSASLLVDHTTPRWRLARRPKPKQGGRGVCPRGSEAGAG